MAALGQAGVGVKGLTGVMTEWPTFNHHTDYTAIVSAQDGTFSSTVWKSDDEAPPSKCDAALQSACGSDNMGTAGACLACAGDNQQVLRAAGCSDVQIQAWCEAQYPFGGSHLIKTREWATTLNTWAGFGNATQWSLCCSTFEGCNTTAKFHAGCDAHNITLTVVHNAGRGRGNPGNFTFGGFVRILSYA